MTTTLITTAISLIPVGYVDLLLICLTAQTNACRVIFMDTTQITIGLSRKTAK